MRSKRIDSKALPAASWTWCRLNLSAPSNFNLQTPSGPGSKAKFFGKSSESNLSINSKRLLMASQPSTVRRIIPSWISSVSSLKTFSLSLLVFLIAGWFSSVLRLFGWSLFSPVFFLVDLFSLCSALGPNLSWQKLQSLCSWLVQPATSWDLGLWPAHRLKPVSGAVSLHHGLLLGTHLRSKARMRRWGNSMFLKGTISLLQNLSGTEDFYKMRLVSRVLQPKRWNRNLGCTQGTLIEAPKRLNVNVPTLA